MTRRAKTRRETTVPASVIDAGRFQNPTQVIDSNSAMQRSTVIRLEVEQANRIYTDEHLAMEQAVVDQISARQSAARAVLHLV